MMKQSFTFMRLALLSATLMTATTARAVQQDSNDASRQIKAEIERLQTSLKANPIKAPELNEVNTMAQDALKNSGTALAAGNLFTSLESLGSAENVVQAARTIEEKVDAMQSGMPAFETEWKKASVELTALGEQARARSWRNKPSALQALAEASQGRALPLLDGARGFAIANGPKDGLFYLGNAKGEAETARFIATLNLASKKGGIPLRSMLPELEALQEKTNAAFQPPRSIEMHPRFIALNSTLKFARELDSSKSYAGALYQYLEAVRHFGMLDPAVPEADKQPALRARVAEERKRLATGRRDDSIAEIFLQRASQFLNKPDGAAPSNDEWRAVRVILEQVLPAYNEALKPAAPLPQRAGKTATLTLVRWPYT